MADKGSLLGSLPGSNLGSGKSEVVSNRTLMPVANKLPGMAPPKANKSDAPAPHLLGSGNKIPESYESRMRSQFSSPDPAIYSRKKRDEGSSEEQGEWWRNEVRPSIPCSSYKSSPGDSAATGKDTKLSWKQRDVAERAARRAEQQKAGAAAETKRLMGQKEAMLHNLCSDPTIGYGHPEVTRVVNVVMEINQKLGLPPANMGSWKLPDA